MQGEVPWRLDSLKPPYLLLLPLTIVLHGTHPTAVAVHVVVAVLVVALVPHRLLHLGCVVENGSRKMLMLDSIEK